jgi:hypothetical protein
VQLKVEVKHSDGALNLDLNNTAKRVLDEFQILPQLRLLSFFDDTDAPFFRGNFGQFNRGQFIALEGTRTIEWPDYITKHIYTCDDSLSVKVLFDNVIYIYGTTCADQVGRVMTFAHELKHFVQYGFNRNLWAKSRLFWGILPAYEIPAEREARIWAKRIAVKLCDDNRVNQYIAQKIDYAERLIPEGTEDRKAIQDEIEDWRFVQRLDTSISYDLEAGTSSAFHRLVERRDELEKTLQDLKTRPEFKDLDLSSYFQS